MKKLVVKLHLYAAAVALIHIIKVVTVETLFETGAHFVFRASEVFAAVMNGAGDAGMH